MELDPFTDPTAFAVLATVNLNLTQAGSFLEFFATASFHTQAGGPAVPDSKGNFYIQILGQPLVPDQGKFSVTVPHSPVLVASHSGSGAVNFRTGTPTTIPNLPPGLYTIQLRIFVPQSPGGGVSFDPINRFDSATLLVQEVTVSSQP
jgi:hypothetical protein